MIIELLGARIETTPEDSVHDGNKKLKLKTFAGWHSSPPITSNVEAMPQSDGGFDPERSYRGPKPMSITGFATANHPEFAEELWDTLAGLAPYGERFDVEVTSVGGIKRTTRCRLNGTISVDPFTATKATFMIPLVAPDGRKYGPEIPLGASAPGVSSAYGLTYPLVGPVGGTLDFGPFSPTGVVTLLNDGTAETWPRFLVTGAIGSGGFEIISGTDVLKYTGSLGVGQSVLLDPYAGGRAFLGGSDVTGEYLTRSEWGSIPPGGARLFAFNPIGNTDSNATMIAQYRKAWW